MTGLDGPKAERMARPGRHTLGVIATLLAGAFLPSLGHAELVMAPVAGPDRVAVVIGNAEYDRIVDLPNALRDAESMAAMLRDFGYTVFSGTNLDRRDFEELLRHAMLNVPEGSDVVFFYAGHGIQIGARNYLLPVDVDFSDVHDLPLYSITLDRVIDALSARGAVHVAIIDACRDNPFPDLQIAADVDATLYETRTGFEPFRTPLNSLVAFSTSPGATAQDGGDGGNSPYTAAIVTTARAEPTESVVTLLGQVREQVYNATGGAQVPWESSTLIAPFQFIDQADSAPVILVEATGEGTETDATANSADRGAPDPLPLIEQSSTMMLDRFIRIDGSLTGALGAELIDPTTVTAPRFGEIAFVPDGGGIYFRPALQEVRSADMPDYQLTDLIEIETGPLDARQTIALNLTLVPDACDIEAGDALDLDGVGLYRYPNEINIDAALAACTAAVAARPDVGRFHYQLGRAQRAAGDFEGALASFETALAASHTRAANALAALLTTQRIDRAVFDIPEDPVRAVELLEAAIEKGDPYAMLTRGVPLLRERLTPEDRLRGFELIDRASELGHTYAMNWLGFYYNEEDTDHLVPPRGIAYLTASAERQDIYGYYGLGLMARRGVDRDAPDYALAYDLLQKASVGGHPTAPTWIGRMIMREELGTPDPVAALAWYDLGLERGDPFAGVNGARIVLDGAAPGQGPAEGAIRAAKAALLPSDEAVANATEILDELDEATLGTALQTLLVALGEPVAIDGAVGPGTINALARVMDAAGLPATVPDAPVERLIAAARVYWARNPVRPDVF
jgi:uncharacterized caspase-like protein/TPR repeat protein